MDIQDKDAVIQNFQRIADLFKERVASRKLEAVEVTVDVGMNFVSLKILISTEWDVALNRIDL